MLTALCLLAATAGPPGPEARDILARGRYQTDLPGYGAPSAAPPSAPERGVPRDAPRAPEGGSGPSLALPALAASGSMIVFVVVAAALVVGLGLVLKLAFDRKGRNAKAVEPEATPPAAAPTGRRALRLGPLTDVEELARQGRFGEAIHLLLLHLFAALQRRPTTAPAPAHTGREVLARTRLASEAQQALGVLVAAAEAVHFGGRTAAQADYEACLGHYRNFLHSFERSAS